MASTTIQRGLSTPTKTAPAEPLQDSPGNWRHPRLAEITRRQQKTTFGERNINKIAYNVVALIALFFVYRFTARYVPATSVLLLPAVHHGLLTNSLNSWPQLRMAARYGLTGICFIPIFNIITAAYPAVVPQDDLADIPLTPGQRKLLGLPPSSRPATPGSVYSTPPRYARTPSLSGSASAQRNYSDPPAEVQSSHAFYRSPVDLGDSVSSSGFNGMGSTMSSNFSMTPSGSPLLQRAMLGARRSSIGSLGSPAPASSIFGGFGGLGPDSPTPNPAAKRSSVGLNNKWLYERGRGGAGQSFLQA